MTTKTKKTTNKKTTKTVEPTVEETIEEVKHVKEKAPEKAKKKKVDLDTLVSCRNITDGQLIYISRKTGLQTLWANYGDEEFIDVAELLTMKASQPKFLTEPWLIIDDDDVIEYLGLKHLYSKIFDLDDIDTFFDVSVDEMKTILDKIPNGIKESIITRARKKIEDETLYDTRKIRLLEEKLKVVFFDE